MPSDAPQFLTGLAQDVIEHGDCKSCKVNAALGLAALGLLEDFLGRSGLPDPRPPQVPFDLPHRDAPPPEPADPEALYQFRLIVSVPDATTRDDLDRLLDQLAAELGATVASSRAQLQSMTTGGLKPRPGQ